MPIDPMGISDGSWIYNVDVGEPQETSNSPNVVYQSGKDYLNNLMGQNRPQLPPSGTSNRESMLKAMASFEDLLILLTQLGSQTRLSERQNQLSALQEKVAQLEASADKKLEAADKMRTGAIVNLAMTLAAATVSLVGAGVQTGQLVSGMSKINKNGLSLQNIKDASAMKPGAPDAKGPADAGGKTGSFEGMSKEGMAGLRNAQLNKLSSKTQITGQFTQGAAQILQGIGSFVQSLMQADSQTLQAEADKIQALAEQIGVFMQQAQNQEADFKDFMQKVNDLIRDFLAAQQKMTEAVSH